VEGHERHDIPPRRARHRLLPEHLPLQGVCEWRGCPTSMRRCNIERDTLDRVQFDMAAVRFRVERRCKL
jgi:hypothetical protein